MERMDNMLLSPTPELSDDKVTEMTNLIIEEQSVSPS